MISDRHITYKSFLQRDVSFKHREYGIEFEYYNLIVDGKLEEVKADFSPFGGDGAGVLSSDPVNNIRYHFVITAALIARYCIEAGMEMETAYTMSDYYINVVDKCRTVEEIEKIHYDMVCDYTVRMKDTERFQVCSKPVILAMEFIYDNLHNHITVNDVAQHVSLSPNYLSRIFHAETGCTVSGYITSYRLTAAKNMLKYSDYSILEISNILSFSSQSHFTNLFKKHVGVSPRDYRNKYYRKDMSQVGKNQ